MPAKPHRRGHDIIVIGASAGGVGALTKLAADLPPNFPASVFIVVHTSPTSIGLPAVIGRNAQLPVGYAKNGEKIQTGHIYVAQSDLHLLIHGKRMLLSRGPRQNGHRPALDPLFRTAALAYGARVVGVVLTGYLDDGTAGLGAIKARNGITVVQDPDDAAVGDMPRSALQNVKVDYCAPLEDIGPLLIRLANKRTKSKKGSPVMEKINFHPTEMEKK